MLGALRRRACFPCQIKAVYFVLAPSSRLIKIGVTSAPQRRFAALRRGSPEELLWLGMMLCPSFGLLEEELHRAFADERARGEWFRVTDRLVDFIADNCLSPDEEADALDFLPPLSSQGEV